MKNIYFYSTKIGKIAIAENNGYITNLFFNLPKNIDEYKICETPILSIAHSQLVEYLSGSRKEFNLKYKIECSTFRSLVYEQLQKIPYGKTLSYKEIANMIGNSRAVRAVGMANNKNPIPIFIPCHRVIGSNGSLIGYSGGLKIKKYLLDLEKEV